MASLRFVFDGRLATCICKDACFTYMFGLQIHPVQSSSMFVMVEVSIRSAASTHFDSTHVVVNYMCSKSVVDFVCMFALQHQEHVFWCNGSTDKTRWDKATKPNTKLFATITALSKSK